VGKSHIAAEVALCFLTTFKPSKVITTAPTFTQVEEILWKEIAYLYQKSQKAKVHLRGDLLKTELNISPEWFAIGISTNEVNRFQGFHSPYLLVIIDEALGVDSTIWEAIDGLHPYRVLAIGNPLSSTGNFYNCFLSPLWNKITISCQDCVDWQNKYGKIAGLVTQEWIDERKEEWGIKSPLYQARVLGEFPQEGSDTLIPLKFVDEARNRVNTEEDDALRIVSADIARFGEDKTVITDRTGHTIDCITCKERIPTTQTAGIIKRHYQDRQADSLAVDDCGVGGGVTDRLVEQRIGVYQFNSGYKQKAIDKNRFKNLYSQFLWIVKKKFEAGLYSLSKIDKKNFEILKNQLCSITYKMHSDGTIWVESTEDMKARGLVSPDHANSFVISEFAFYMGAMSEIKSYSYR